MHKLITDDVIERAHRHVLIKFSPATPATVTKTMTLTLAGELMI